MELQSLFLHGKIFLLFSRRGKKTTKTYAHILFPDQIYTFKAHLGGNEEVASAI